MPTNTNYESLITVKEAAKLFNIKESRLRWEIYLKRIPHYRMGSSVRLRASEIEKWLKPQRVNHD